MADEAAAVVGAVTVVRAAAAPSTGLGSADFVVTTPVFVDTSIIVEPAGISVAASPKSFDKVNEKPCPGLLLPSVATADAKIGLISVDSGNLNWNVEGVVPSTENVFSDDDEVSGNLKENVGDVEVVTAASSSFEELAPKEDPSVEGNVAENKGLLEVASSEVGGTPESKDNEGLLEAIAAEEDCVVVVAFEPNENPALLEAPNDEVFVATELVVVVNAFEPDAAKAPKVGFVTPNAERTVELDATEVGADTTVEDTEPD